MPILTSSLVTQLMNFWRRLERIERSRINFSMLSPVSSESAGECRRDSLRFGRWRTRWRGSVQKGDEGVNRLLCKVKNTLNDLVNIIPYRALIWLQLHIRRSYVLDVIFLWVKVTYNHVTFDLWIFLWFVRLLAEIVRVRARTGVRSGSDYCPAMFGWWFELLRAGWVRTGTRCV